jgi:hypothetical protein
MAGALEWFAQTSEPGAKRIAYLTPRHDLSNADCATPWASDMPEDANAANLGTV